MALMNILNLRDSYLIANQVITPSMETFQIANAEEEFGTPPYILTLVTALDYLTLKEAERIYVDSATDDTIHCTRGFDGSTPRDWDTTGGKQVFVYMLFTAGYYTELRDAIDFLENKPIVLEMSNVDLDIASVLTHKISVSDGLNEDAGWNVTYGVDPALANPYSITINTTSPLDQFTGRLRFYATGNIRLDSSAYVNIYAKNDINMVADDIWLNTIFQAGLDVVRTLGTVEHNALVSFLNGLKLSDKDIEDPEPGMIKFVESGSPGFWGFYDGEWHKLGFTAQILIGQSTLYYCYVDGNQLEGSMTLDVKDISGYGTIIPGDKLMINNNPYTVETFTPSGPDSGTVNLDIGLVEDVFDMDPVLIVRTVSDADDGYTIRYNKGLEEWNATNILVISEFDTGHTVVRSHFDIGPTDELIPQPRNLTVSGAITMGALQFGDPLIAGTIHYRANQYYATLETIDMYGDPTVIEVPLLPQGAYEFLSLIEIPVGAPNGIMIRYDTNEHQWVATEEITINPRTGFKQIIIGGNSSQIDEIIMNKPVTFNFPVSLDLGVMFEQRVTFKDSIRVYNDGFTPIEEGLSPVLYECNFDYWPNFERYSGVVKGMYMWTGRATAGGSLKYRPFYELPFLTDVTIPGGQSGAYHMMPFTYQGGPVNNPTDTSNAHWELRYVDYEEKAGEIRFPPRMNDETYKDHTHPWDDIDQDTVVFPTDFSHLDLPREADRPETEAGVYHIVPGASKTDPFQYTMRYFRICADDIKAPGMGQNHTNDLWVSDARARIKDDVEYMYFNQSFYGDIFIRRMTPGPDPNFIGGHLYIDSIIRVGDVVAEEETTPTVLLPGSIRYHTGGLEITENPGDFQGYCCVGTDEEGEPWFSWVSLTGSIPKPTTQRFGGSLFFNGDIYSPKWEYTDKILQRRGIFEFDLPVTFHHDMTIDGMLVCDYIQAGPIQVGDAEWCDGYLDPRVRAGLLKFHENTLWLFTDGMWKDLLAINAVEIDIPIIPTEDGVILRWDNTGLVWEATGLLRVPSDTPDRIEMFAPLTIDGTLTVNYNGYFNQELYVTERAYFAEMIRIGTPLQHNFEGLIRYNGDFEGYIPDIGWVSFTRHFEESLTSPATDVGQMLVSSQVGDHFDWTVSPVIRATDDVFELALNLDVFGELTVTGTTLIEESLTIKKALAVGNNYPLSGLIRIPSITQVTPPGSNYIIVFEFEEYLPATGGFITYVDALGYEYTNQITGYDINTGKIYFSDTTVNGTILGGSCSYDCLHATSPGSISADKIFAQAGMFPVLNTHLFYADSITIGHLGVAIPGTIRYIDNEFQGLYYGGVWKSFGPIDLEDYFNITPEWWTRTYGDVMIDDGYGRFMITDGLNVGPDTLTMGKTLSFRRHWDINTWAPGDSLGVASESDQHEMVFRMYTVDPTNPGAEAHINQVLRLNTYKGSVLWSDFEIGGDLRVMDELYVGSTAGLVDPERKLKLYVGGGGVMIGDFRCFDFESTNIYCTGEFEALGDTQLHGNIIIDGGSITQYGGQFIFGTFVAPYTNYLATGMNWLGGNTNLEGDLYIDGDARVRDYLRIGLSLQLGPIDLWSVQAFEGEKQFAIETDESGNLYARRSLYCAHYVVPGHPGYQGDAYYTPKGAIRYTSEGPLDRGDWEGWDGLSWRSMTHSTIIDPDTFFGPTAHGYNINYSEFTGLWEANNRLRSIAIWPGHEDIERVEINVPLDIGITSPDPAVGRIRFTGTDFEGSIDGLTWLSLTVSHDIEGAATEGDTVRYNSSTSIYNPSSSLKNYITYMQFNVPAIIAGKTFELNSTYIPFDFGPISIIEVNGAYDVTIMDLPSMTIYNTLPYASTTTLIKGYTLDINTATSAAPLYGIDFRNWNIDLSWLYAINIDNMTSQNHDVYAIKIGTLSAPSGTAYCFHASTGIAHFGNDVDILGTLTVDTIEHLGASISIQGPIIIPPITAAGSINLFTFSPVILDTGIFNTQYFYGIALSSITIDASIPVDDSKAYVFYSSSIHISGDAIDQGIYGISLSNYQAGMTIVGMDLADFTADEVVGVNITHMHSVASGYGIKIVNSDSTNENFYGIYVDTITAPSGTAYGIYINSGLAYFNDDIYSTGTLFVDVIEHIGSSLTIKPPIDFPNMNFSVLTSDFSYLKMGNINVASVSDLSAKIIGVWLPSFQIVDISNSTETYGIYFTYGTLVTTEPYKAIYFNNLETNSDIYGLHLNDWQTNSAGNIYGVRCSNWVTTNGNIYGFYMDNISMTDTDGVAYGSLISIISAYDVYGHSVTVEGENIATGLNITVLSQNSTAQGINILGVTTNSTNGNATGIHIANIANTISSIGVAQGIRIHNLSAASGIIYSVKAESGVGQFWHDLETFGILRVGSSIESLDASLTCSVTRASVVPAFGYNIDSTFWTAGIIPIVPIQIMMQLGTLDTSYALGDVHTYCSFATGRVQQTGANTVSGSLYGIYINPVMAIGAVSASSSAYGVYISAIESSVEGNAYGIRILDVTSDSFAYSIYTGLGVVHFGDIVNTVGHYEIDGIQVVSNRIVNTAFANILPETVAYTGSWSGGDHIYVGNDISALNAKVNRILEALRTHGLIATT